MQNGAPSWKDYEELLKRLSQIVQANTRSLQLLHAAILADARIADETRQLVSALRASSGSDAERLVSKLEVLTDASRGAREAARDALVESRATNDRLGVTREEIGSLRLELRARGDLTPPQGVALQKIEEDGITVRQGKMTFTANVSVWGIAKKYGPIVLGSGLGGGTAWHFLRHLFGL